MNLPRAIGYLGIALLLVIATFGAVLSFANHDWRGVLIMAGFFVILAFFWHGLRSAAKRENDLAFKEENNLGWYGESVCALFRGPVLHTPEGLALLLGSAISLLFAILSWFVPSIVALSPSRSPINTTLFCLWPILLFVIYIKFCAPDFKPGIYTSLVMLGATCFPFYLAYK